MYDAPECLAQCSRPAFLGNLSEYSVCTDGIDYHRLFYKSAKENNDSAFRWMWLTIVLSFAFYIPVVLWADVIPMIGMLMIPKTCAYVWTVLIGYKAMEKEIA